KVGDTLSEGGVVAVIEAAGDAAQEAPAEAPAPAQPAAGAEKPAAPENRTAETTAKVEPVAVPGQRDNIARGDVIRSGDTVPTPARRLDADGLMPDKVPYASPAVRLFASELGVDLSRVPGSARGGRITKEDVQQFVKGALAGGGGVAAGGGGGLNLLPWPKVDFSKFGEVEVKPLSKIKKISGANLTRNWAMIPHVTQHDDADVTDLEALRKALNKENEKSGVKLTMLAFLMKASVAALQKYPEFNASLDESGENLTLKKYFHIGFAADTPNGLVVPVVRDCDRKGVLEI